MDEAAKKYDHKTAEDNGVTEVVADVVPEVNLDAAEKSKSGNTKLTGATTGVATKVMCG